MSREFPVKYCSILRQHKSCCQQCTINVFRLDIMVEFTSCPSVSNSQHEFCCRQVLGVHKFDMSTSTWLFPYIFITVEGP